MTTPLPKRSRAHVLETLSRQHVESIFPAEWICRRVEGDYGLDLRVEIVADEQVTALEFSTQLKAIDYLSPGRPPPSNSPPTSPPSPAATTTWPTWTPSSTPEPAAPSASSVSRSGAASTTRRDNDQLRLVHTGMGEEAKRWRARAAGDTTTEWDINGLFLSALRGLAGCSKRVCHPHPTSGGGVIVSTHGRGWHTPQAARR